MKELKDIIKRLNRITDLVKEKDGQVIDLVKEKTFVKGFFLHQDTEEMSEEKSAAFERGNPELFNFLRAFDDKMREVF